MTLSSRQKNPIQNFWNTPTTPQLAPQTTRKRRRRGAFEPTAEQAEREFNVLMGRDPDDKDPGPPEL